MQVFTASCGRLDAILHWIVLPACFWLVNEFETNAGGYFVEWNFNEMVDRICNNYYEVNELAITINMWGSLGCGWKELNIPNICGSDW